jgi:hypothetical protein
VLECHHITGALNYILKVRVGTSRDLETFLATTVKSVEGVPRTAKVTWGAEHLARLRLGDVRTTLLMRNCNARAFGLPISSMPAGRWSRRTEPPIRKLEIDAAYQYPSRDAG